MENISGSQPFNRSSAEPRSLSVVASNASEEPQSNLPGIRLLGTLKSDSIASVSAKTNLIDGCSVCGSSFHLHPDKNRCARCRLTARFAVLIGDEAHQHKHQHQQQQLLMSVWNEIRRILCLPAAIEKTPGIQADTVRELLDAFVDHYPIERQRSMTGREEVEVAVRLNELPRIPQSFARLIARAAVISEATAAARTGRQRQEEDIAAGKSMEIETDETLPPASEMTNKENASYASLTVAAAAAAVPPIVGRRYKRKHILPAAFIKIVERDGSDCFWCGKSVMRPSLIPPGNRLSSDGGETIVYLTDGGERREMAVATIDHLLRVRDGGDNNPENLVVSCCPCNQARELSR